MAVVDALRRTSSVASPGPHGSIQKSPCTSPTSEAEHHADTHPHDVGQLPLGTLSAIARQDADGDSFANVEVDAAALSSDTQN